MENAFCQVRYYFNPRLHEGGDRIGQKKSFGREFQSTPPRRRRQGIRKTPEQIRISIHASTKEATNKEETACSNMQNFNPRLHEGGDFFLKRATIA